MSRRSERVSELVRRELSWLIANEIHDPRLPALVSITQVDLSVDLRHANVYVSIMGTEAEKRSGMQALKAAAGFLHRAMKPRLALRFVPEVSFQPDDSIEVGGRTLKLMDDLGPPPGPS